MVQQRGKRSKMLCVIGYVKKLVEELPDRRVDF